MILAVLDRGECFGVPTLGDGGRGDILCCISSSSISSLVGG